MGVMTDVDDALYDRMSQDATLIAIIPANKMFRQQVFQGTKHPYLVYVLDSSEDMYTLGAMSFTELQYSVELYDREHGVDTLKAAYDRVHTLLQDKPLSLASGTNVYLRRTELITGHYEDRGGEIYNVYGGRYRIVVTY